LLSPALYLIGTLAIREQPGRALAELGWLECVRGNFSAARAELEEVEVLCKAQRYVSVGSASTPTWIILPKGRRKRRMRRRCKDGPTLNSP
jgi:hypothetical protein